MMAEETVYVWINGQKLEMTRAEFEADFPPPVFPDPVVASVSMRQAKLQLSRAGLLSQVNQFIEEMEGQDGEEARIEWDYATELRRDHPLVVALGPQFDLTEQDIDGLFLAASQIA